MNRKCLFIVQLLVLCASSNMAQAMQAVPLPPPSSALMTIAEQMLKDELSAEGLGKIAGTFLEATKELKTGAGRCLGCTIEEAQENEKTSITKAVSFFEKGLAVIHRQLDKQREDIEQFSLDRSREDLERIVLPTLKAYEDTSKQVLKSVGKAQGFLVDQLGTQVFGIPVGRILLPAISEVEKIRKQSQAWFDAALIQRSECERLILRETSKLQPSTQGVVSTPTSQSTGSVSAQPAIEFSDELRAALRRQKEREEAAERAVTLRGEQASSEQRQENSREYRERARITREAIKEATQTADKARADLGGRAEGYSRELEARINASRSKVERAGVEQDAFDLTEFMKADSSKDSQEAEASPSTPEGGNLSAKVGSSAASYKVAFKNVPADMKENLSKYINEGFQVIGKAPQFYSGPEGIFVQAEGLDQKQRQFLDEHFQHYFRMLEQISRKKDGSVPRN